MMNTEKLDLTEEWDKTFPQSEKVNHKKVTFVNRYGITLAADMYTPKNVDGKLAAIAVCGPFGAVKDQASGLYAQEMAERGFLTIAFDPSFTGESGGTPRFMASPDINTEDYQAAVDFLSVQENVDAEKIGIIGICGFGGMALNAAAIDTRIKATVISTMYDMSRIGAKGYFDSEDNEEARFQKRVAFNTQRTEDYKNGNYAGKVIGINASARADGNTAILINKVFEELHTNGIETELIQLAGEMIEPCKACWACGGKGNCIHSRDSFRTIFDKMKEADGIILGSPVYSANVSANMQALLERAAVVADMNPGLFKHKVGISVAAVRRAGGLQSIDTMNHFFLNHEMYIAGSTYWNMGYGQQAGDVNKDEEGLVNMKNLGTNMGYLLKKLVD